MIIYFDSGDRNVFSNIIIENGQTCSRHYHYLLPGRLGRYIGNKGLFSHLPEADISDPLIIVFDTATNFSYMKKIKSKYPDKQIIYWCWNRISQKDSDKVENIKKIVPVWSYSPEDCQRYGLMYNTQFFFDNLIPDDISETPRVYNPKEPLRALFVGRDKEERSGIIRQCVSELKACGVEVVIHITKPGIKIKKKTIICEKLIPYKTIIEKCKDVDIIIDCYGYERSGCSLRVMEAMFFGKKLITDNQALTDYDFYDSHNIFIIGKERRNLKDFLNEPYVPVPEEIRDRYRFSNWINRFM